jgi:hypothetical protein
VHDIAGGTENHGIYLDSKATNVEIAYNDIHHVTSGNLIQTFDNLGGRPITGLNIHHNLIHDGGRYGLNMSDGTVSGHAYNNVIYNTAFAGIRINESGSGLSQVYEHNTLYNVCTNHPSESGAIQNTEQATSGSIKIQFNVIAKTSGGCSQGYANNSSDSAISLSRNLYSGYGPSNKDLNALISQLGSAMTSAGSLNFTLKPGSPAIDGAVGSTMKDDYLNIGRSGTPDVGAYEYK